MTRSAQIAITASADEAGTVAREAMREDRLANAYTNTFTDIAVMLRPPAFGEQAMWARLRTARRNAIDTARMLRMTCYASIWNTLETECADYWWEARQALTEIRRARYAQQKMGGG